MSLTGLACSMMLIASLDGAIEPAPIRAIPKPEVATVGLFAIVFRPGPAWKPGLPMSEQGLLKHGQYWAGLFKAGRVFSAGLMGADGGLVLFHARDLAAAEAVLEADPAIETGIFVGDARPYAPRFLSKEPLIVGRP
jgi:hypothetical protein